MKYALKCVVGGFIVALFAGVIMYGTTNFSDTQIDEIRQLKESYQISETRGVEEILIENCNDEFSVSVTDQNGDVQNVKSTKVVASPTSKCNLHVQQIVVSNVDLITIESGFSVKISGYAEAAQSTTVLEEYRKFFFTIMLAIWLVATLVIWFMFKI